MKAVQHSFYNHPSPDTIKTVGSLDSDVNRPETSSKNFSVKPSHSDPTHTTRPRHANLLANLLSCEETLAETATRPVIFSEPLISRHNTGIFGRGTINIVQGAYGSHKSRLAESFAALMLNDNPDAEFAGFTRPAGEKFVVCCIDTERNQDEELPHAVQGIKLKAGFTLTNKPENFRFTSLKSVERHSRLKAIEMFIKHARDQTGLHLFTLIDVVTDAIADFNDPKETLKLFDFLGNLCDRHNTTFLLVIHQNPGTEKARGHIGTEAVNKASTVIQIGLVKEADGKESDLIKLRYMKLRRGKRPEPLHLQFNEQNQGLMVATGESITKYVNQRKDKAPVDDIAERLQRMLSAGPMPKGEVVNTLMSEFSASNKTVRERLRIITEQPTAMCDDEGQAVILADGRDNGKEVYRLKRINS